MFKSENEKIRDKIIEHEIRYNQRKKNNKTLSKRQEQDHRIPPLNPITELKKRTPSINEYIKKETLDQNDIG